jgi:putative addiction module component (TIGR02574 family)
MTKKQILAQALSLDPRERSELAEELWLSLDDATQEEIHEAWALELRRRIEALDRGGMKTVAAEEVFERMKKRLKR